MEQESLNKKKGIVDIVFLIDITGSMQPCLDALKNNIGLLVDTMVNPGPNADNVVKDWRIKICGYRDAAADGSQWWEEKPFRTDVTQVRADLATLEAKGGGDEPESLLDGLWKIAKMESVAQGAQAMENAWRDRHDAARCVIVFTDASTHMQTSIPEANGAQFADVNNAIRESKLRISLYAPEAPCYMDDLSQIDGIEYDRVGTLSGDAQEAMKEFSSHTENFQKTMKQLAKSISQSAVTPAL
jgi:hypothetical protein